MKKLMIAAAIVCVAAFAQAGAVQWGSGTMKGPAADGSLGDKLKSGQGYSAIDAYVFESFSPLATFTEADLYNWYAAGADTTKSPIEGATITHLAEPKAPGSSSTTVSFAGSLNDANAGTAIYGALLYVLKDTSDPAKDVWYMVNQGQAATMAGASPASMSNMALKIGGTGDATHWTTAAVPEPTSAMLLLLGMAGLALRRRRA